MAAIGRALMSNPRLLLCDEISLGLAPIVVRDIYARLPAIVGEGLSLIVVEQDIAQALKAAAPRLLPAGRPRRACGRGERADARAHLRRLFRSVTAMEWVNIILQGVLIGGLYAMFAAGLSLIFGVMRLVNIAHGDLIVLAAYVALMVTQTLGIGPLTSLHPGRADDGDRSATRCSACCSTARSATTCCRRCWSPSACRSSSRTGCWNCSPPTAASCRRAPSRSQTFQVVRGRLGRRAAAASSSSSRSR